MQTFATKVIQFNRSLHFDKALPEGVNIMNPFFDDEVRRVSDKFYQKYYNDTNKRFLILGINPGRFGAGHTGIPFTDSKHLRDVCGIEFSGKTTHEPSSVFIYEVISAYGGAENFYNNFLFHSIFPLAFTKKNEKGNEINYNYYDSKELTNIVYDSIIENIQNIISFGIDTSCCFCLGKGKNEKFLQTINQKYHFFNQIVPLAHPRFIMQYKSKEKIAFINEYLQKLRQLC